MVGNNFELSKKHCLLISCQFTFFIYLFHEPTLNIVRKLLVYMMGKNEIGYMLSYLLSPFLFAFAAVLVGLVFRAYFPKIYGYCVGGR